MVKHCLIWKQVKCKNIAGEPVWLPTPEIIAAQYRGTLVSQILSMQRQSGLSFEAAINLVAEKRMAAFTAGRMGHNPGEYSWYADNFVEWISSLGYHIELTGDEFEPYVLSAQLT